jgi:hypothetical protein
VGRWRGLIATPLSPIGLRSQVLVLILVAVGPAVVMLLSSAIEIRRGAIREGRAEVVRIARLLADDQEDRIQEARQLLVALGGMAAVREQRRVECSGLVSRTYATCPYCVNRRRD